MHVPAITPEAYLAAERASEFRSEYVNGEIFAMSGGSRNHAFLIVNCARALARISHKPPICIQNRERSAVIRVDFPVFEKSTLGLAKAPLSGARLRA
jgi:Uma2 family endonuclease